MQRKINVRSLFGKIFGDEKNTTAPTTSTKFSLLSTFDPVFTNYDGSKLYDSNSIRMCIDAIARNAAKLSPKHIINTKKGFKSVYGNISYLLSTQPNDYQNAYQFFYYIATELMTYNNAFVYILRDSNMKIIGLYPLHYESLSFFESKDNEIYIQFKFVTGKVRYVALKNCIHLTRFTTKDGVYGGNNIPIVKTMSLKHVISEGIINAIKTTASIKGIVKSTQAMLKPEDVERTRLDFVKSLQEANDGYGIAALDAKSDFTSIKLEPTTATDGQISNVDEDIMSYYGINKNIIMSKFSEDEWNAFYESVLEPIGLQMSLEFTNKLFTYSERLKGNKIVFTSNRLQYASNKTKIELIRYANNILMIDELREVLNLEPLPEGQGQKVMQDLNHIDSDIANEYQKGDSNNE